MALFPFRALMAAALIAALACSAAAKEGGAAKDGLGTALTLAASLHPSIRGRRDELRALGFDRESAGYQRYPTLSLQAQTMSNNQHQVAVVLQQPLWVGGRIDAGIEQADVKVKVGRASLLGVERQILENTAAAYAALQGARLRRKAAVLNVSEHEKLKGLIARREVGGIASKADVLLADSRLAQAVTQFIQLQGVLVRAGNDLLALTQEPVPGDEPVAEGLSQLPETGGIVAAIEKSSATVQQRLYEVELAENASHLAVAAMKPSLYAKLEQDVYAVDQFGSTTHGTSIGALLQGSLEGMGLAGWKRVNSANARVDSAQRDVAAARVDARRQATGLVTDLTSLRQEVVSNEKLVQALQDTLASFMRQYDAGRKSWVDVLNAQRELSDARLTLEQSKSSLEETTLRLAAQLGQFDAFTGAP